MRSIRTRPFCGAGVLCCGAPGGGIIQSSAPELAVCVQQSIASPSQESCAWDAFRGDVGEVGNFAMDILLD